MLQKTVIKRTNKIVVGVSYDYSKEETRLFIIAKFFKDLGYTYEQIKSKMDEFSIDKEKVIDEAKKEILLRIDSLKDLLDKAEKLKDESDSWE